MVKNLSLPTDFSSGGADNEVPTPFVNNLEYEVRVDEHGNLLSDVDPMLVASSSQDRNVSATPPSVVGRPLITTHILNNQNVSPEIGHETSNGVVLVNNGDQLIKVFMDGRPVGQRVDLSSHNSFEAMTKTLDNMFCRCGLNMKEVGPFYLLSGQFEYVHTFQDQEQDLMFAAGYLWLEFQRLVKKIRITKNLESLCLGYCERTAQAASPEESRTTDNI